MIRKLLLLFMLLLFSTLLIAESAERKEINRLRRQIVALSQSYQNNLHSNEAKGKRELARSQANLLIKVVSYEIYIKFKKAGIKRSLADIRSAVNAAWLNSWVFTDLGRDHISRFELILQWGYMESNYKKDLVSKWKAGTYIKKLDKKVLRDTTDYGVWQINEGHRNTIKTLNYLYDSGVINFKMKRIKRLWDVMDINTNCATRCLIETDRKKRGWEWRHFKEDEPFYLFLKSAIERLEKEGLYDRVFVQQNYHASPIKTYSLRGK